MWLYPEASCFKVAVKKAPCFLKLLYPCVHNILINLKAKQWLLKGAKIGYKDFL